MPSNNEEDHHNIIIDDEDLEEEDDEEDLEEEDDGEDIESEDEDDDEEIDHQQQPLKEEHDIHSAFLIPTAATSTATTTPSLQPPKRQTTPTTPANLPITTTTPEEKKPTPLPLPFDDSRRLFQRLWTDEDEIGLLQGFLDYTSQRGGFKNSAYHHDTAPFYDQIKSRLQLDFNKNQLVEKLRRLKKKYRNVMSRINSGKEFSFKTPHDQATFEISRKIWCGLDGVGEDDEEHGGGGGNHLHVVANNTEINGGAHHLEKKGSGASSSRSRKRSRNGAPPPPVLPIAVEENVSDPANLLNCPVNSSLPNVIEETVRSCLSPLFKELMFSAVNGLGNSRGIGGVGFNLLPLNFGSSSSLGGVGEKDVMDEKWRKQQILELEVYSKRVELVQEQIKLQLEELRSMSGR